MQILPDDARIGRIASVCLRDALSADFAGTRIGRIASVCLRGALSADFAGRDWMEIAFVCLRFSERGLDGLLSPVCAAH